MLFVLHPFLRVLVAAWLGVLLFNCFCSTVSNKQRVPSGPSSLNAIGNYDEGNCCTAVPYASEIIAATQNPICRRCTGGASCSNALCCSLGVRFYCRAAALIRAGSPGTHNGIATREQAHEQTRVVISLLLAVLQPLLARSQQKAASETQESVAFSRMPQKKHVTQPKKDVRRKPSGSCHHRSC